MHEHQFLDYPEGKRCPCGQLPDANETVEVINDAPTEPVQEEVAPEVPQEQVAPVESEAPVEPEQPVAPEVPVETVEEAQVPEQAQEEATVETESNTEPVVTYFTRMKDDIAYITASLKEFKANNGGEEVPSTLTMAIANLDASLELITKTVEVIAK